MMNALLEGLHTISAVNTFTVVVLTGLVASSFFLIKASTGSFFLSAVFLPFLVLGGLTSRYFLEQGFIDLLNDKDSNTVLYLAIGVLGAMLVMTMIAKAFGSFQDWRFSRKRVGNGVATAK